MDYTRDAACWAQRSYSSSSSFSSSKSCSSYQFINHPGTRFSPATASDLTDRIEDEDDDENEYDGPCEVHQLTVAALRKMRRQTSQYGKATETTKVETRNPSFVSVFVSFVIFPYCRFFWIAMDGHSRGRYSPGP